MTQTAAPSTLHARTHHLLTDSAAARERQLAGLPGFDGDLVAEAHRASVERILTDIRAALERLRSGTYGDCGRCFEAIPPERLELLDGTGRCVRCAAC